MRFKRFVGSEEITPGSPVTFRIPSGRFVGLLCRLTGTTDTSQTLTTAEIGGFRLQRGGRTIQSETFEFYHDFDDLIKGFPEATLPTAGATAVSVFIPFFAPRLMNTMEVRNDQELRLFFDPLSGLATEFGSNAITLEVYAMGETEVQETYELHVTTQDFTAGSTGKKTLNMDANNVAYLFARSTVVSTVQIDVDGTTLEPSIDIDVQNAWANMEWAVEVTGNDLVPYQTGSQSLIGSYLNDSVLVYPTFTSTGSLELTIFSIQPSPAGVPELSAQRVGKVKAEVNKRAQRNLANLSAPGSS